VPFIQCDLQVGLTVEQKETLIRKMTEATHKAIGSAHRHINVVLREHPGCNLGEAGEPNRDLMKQPAWGGKARAA
jgi:4-oxalocrotonate tautomerase family enzyme